MVLLNRKEVPMATKKNPVDAPAAAAQTPVVEQVETPTPSRRGLQLGGIIAGGVLAAALLFGGGVLVGTALPDQGRADFAQGQGPIGGQPQAGPQNGPQSGPQRDGPQSGPQGNPSGERPHAPQGDRDSDDN
jgi:hypothetical protein